MGFAVPEQIETRLFINGEVREKRRVDFLKPQTVDLSQFVESSDGKEFEVKSPYSHERVATGMITHKRRSCMIASVLTSQKSQRHRRPISTRQSPLPKPHFRHGLG